jgi:hypothetical protein
MLLLLPELKKMPHMLPGWKKLKEPLLPLTNVLN